MKHASTHRTWQRVLAICLKAVAILLLLLAVYRISGHVSAEGETTWPTISLAQHVTGLTQPVHITHAGDGGGRLFVVERAGYIRIFKDGALLGTPFLDITDRVKSDGYEQGLLSVAFPHDYANSGYFYVNYTATAGSGDTVVSRFQVTANPDVADPNSEQVVLTVDQPQTNHNGGQLAFAPADGNLYIGMGDGGGGGDTDNNAQNPAVLLGKMLRIDVMPVATDVYTIPPDNPFVNDPGTESEIWALGLRNPWRFSFDRQTADLYIADVGQNAWEEIDFQAAASAGGENYGWRCKEGTHNYNWSGNCSTLTLVPPVHEYSHASGDHSITGGFVYRGLNYCQMQGIYFYGDYESGRMWGLQYDSGSWQASSTLLSTGFSISTFGEDEAGNLYVADYFGGKVHQVTTASPATYPDLASPAGIDAADVQAAAARWHQQPGDTSPGWDGRFDISADGDTDVVDVMMVAAAMGSACP